MKKTSSRTFFSEFILSYFSIRELARQGRICHNLAENLTEDLLFNNSVAAFVLQSSNCFENFHNVYVKLD